MPVALHPATCLLRSALPCVRHAELPRNMLRSKLRSAWEHGRFIEPIDALLRRGTSHPKLVTEFRKKAFPKEGQEAC